MTRATGVDPLLRCDGVEVADDLRLVDGVPGRLDPDVRSPGRVVLARPEEEADLLSVTNGDGARRVLLRPQQCHFVTGRLGGLEPSGEQRLGAAMGAMPRREQRSCSVEVILRERTNLEAAHRATLAAIGCGCDARDVRESSSKQRTTVVSARDALRTERGPEHRVPGIR